MLNLEQKGTVSLCVWIRKPVKMSVLSDTDEIKVKHRHFILFEHF